MNSIQPELFGNDLKIKKAVNFGNNLAVTKAPVLIVGEAGTGKKSLAQYIHNKSSRGDNPIIFVDCNEDHEVVKNKILGHRDQELGRFVKGALEEGNKGTVVLCNVDNLEESFQKRLYTIFQELSDYDLDVRFIGTTTKNLSKLVGSGRFYRALYTYIAGSQINLTPLRERPDDIKMLSEAFLGQICVDKSLTSPSISEDAMNKLTSHYWTHNLKELMSVMESSLERCEGDALEAAMLTIGERQIVNFADDEDDDGIKLMSLKEAEKLLIKKALIHTSENRTQAAKILGVSIRTLRNKINEYRNDGSTYFVNLR